jgi:hypothetical protein
MLADGPRVLVVFQVEANDVAMFFVWKSGDGRVCGFEAET